MKKYNQKGVCPITFGRYCMWDFVERDVNKHPHNIKDSLKAPIVTVIENIDKDYLKHTCSRFRS